MRLGIVRGHVVLSVAISEIRGIRLLIVEPVSAENLAKNDGSGGGKGKDDAGGHFVFGVVGGKEGMPRCFSFSHGVKLAERPA